MTVTEYPKEKLARDTHPAYKHTSEQHRRRLLATGGVSASIPSDSMSEKDATDSIHVCCSLDGMSEESLQY